MDVELNKNWNEIFNEVLTSLPDSLIHDTDFYAVNLKAPKRK